MRHTNKLMLSALIAAFVVTAAVSAAIGYSAGVTRGTNMHFTYPSFVTIVKRPSVPAMQNKKDIERYEAEGKEYVEAAEIYLMNTLGDIDIISAESEAATDEVNDFITEYNLIMQMHESD